MIRTKKELKYVLEQEKKLYYHYNRKDLFINIITSDGRLLIWRFIKILRTCEYHYNNKNRSLVHSLLYLYYRRKKNKWGLKLGIDIWENSFDQGLMIYHPGNIIINGNAKIGKNCKLHGDNCIGNDGKTIKCPVIGDNVDIGIGVSIIGDITICDNVIIGAGAVVINSITESGTYVGVPAKKVGI